MSGLRGATCQAMGKSNMSSSREIPLLSIAHPVEGNTIPGTEDALGDGTHPGP